MTNDKFINTYRSYTQAGKFISKESNYNGKTKGII